MGNGNAQESKFAATIVDKPVQRTSLREKLAVFKVKSAGIANDDAAPEETEEQNYDMIYNVPNNGVEEKAQKGENKKLQDKIAGRVFLKECVAQNRAIVSGKGNEPQEKMKKEQKGISV